MDKNPPALPTPLSRGVLRQTFKNEHQVSKMMVTSKIQAIGFLLLLTGLRTQQWMCTLPITGSFIPFTVVHESDGGQHWERNPDHSIDICEEIQNLETRHFF